MGPVTFITVVNEEYFHHLPRLLHTLTIHIPSFDLIVYGVNLSNHSLSSDLLNKKNVQIVNYRQLFKKFEFERGYCVNLRAFALNEVASMQPNGAILIYVDVNLLILPAFKNFLEQMYGDLAISVDTNHPCYSDKSIFRFFWPKGPLGSSQFGVITAGIQIYKISQKTKEFLHDYAKLLEQKKLSWYADQEGIFLLLKANKNILIYNLDKILCIGRAPTNHDIVVYKKGGANNSFYEDLSAGCYYKLEKISEVDPELSKTETLFHKVTDINIGQRIFRKLLMLFRRV